MLAVAEGVHRLPETAMEEGLNRAAGDEGAHGFMLEHLAIVRDVAEYVKIEHEEAAVDPATFVTRLFAERGDVGALDTETSESCRGPDAGHGHTLAMGLVKSDGGGDVDVGYAIAVRHAEGLFAFDEFRDLLEAATGSGLFAGVD